jgi:hypothetical protein
MSINSNNSGLPIIGVQHIEGGKKTLSTARVGRPQFDETRRKISESTKGEKNHFFGRHRNEETKKRLSEKNSGRPA